MGQLPNMLYLASIWVIPLVIAITFHEEAHGFVARFLGDETAWKLGRVSLNPIKHIDPFGTILLPGLLLLLRSPFLFGYAKPVPVDFRALRNPRSGMVLVAAAGLDRLTHHVHILQMNGNSYRLNQSKRHSRHSSSDTPADHPNQA